MRRIMFLYVRYFGIFCVCTIAPTSLAEPALDVLRINEPYAIIHSTAQAPYTWLREVRDTYVAQQRPPTSWFWATRDGFYTTKVDIEDIFEPSYGDLFAKTVFYRNRPDPDYLTMEALQKPLWIGKVRQGVNWLERSTKNINAFQNWLETNQNRPNVFPKRLVDELTQDGQPWHSEFYKDFNLAGLNMVHLVLIDPDVITSSRMIIPAKFSQTGRYDEIITLDPKQSSLSKSCLRTRNLLR